MSLGEHFNSQGLPDGKGGGSERKGDLLKRGLLEGGFLERVFLERGVLEWALLERGL